MIFEAFQPISEGRSRESCGKATIMAIQAKRLRTKGRAALYMTSSGTSATPLSTKRFMPKGGVMPAMFFTRVMTTPNHTRSHPKFLASGRKIGMQMSTSGRAGMKQPRKHREKMMTHKMTMGGMSSPATLLANTMGMRLMVMKKPKRSPARISAKHMEIKRAEESRAVRKFFRVRRRNVRARSR